MTTRLTKMSWIDRRIGGAYPWRARRGSTIVLVAAILVLLVIIATSYLATTQIQRVASSALQSAAMRDDNREVIAEMLAQELADALFVWPVDYEDPMLDYTGVADANFPRKRPAPDAERYGVDEYYPYNFAPYHTAPFTNWPDWTLRGAETGENRFSGPYLPTGPGNEDPNAGSGGSIAWLLSAEHNPIGNPGFGDNRWLRDTEPMRWDTDAIPGSLALDDLDAFSHWRKLSNIARANNGWRIVWDISDVDNHIMTDLNVPVEQWLAQPPFTGPGILPFNVNTGLVNANILFQNNPSNWYNTFWRQWRAWFNASGIPGVTYEVAYDTDGAPPNLYKLNDLDGDGTLHNSNHGDRPEDEFIRGTARHTIGRVLTDTDGDGFTDSFWFLSPTPVRNGIRQIVGVSIVDNSARVNANVATRFWPHDEPVANMNDRERRKTRGHTPADIALVGQMHGNPSSSGGDAFEHWNVGLYDNPANWSDSNVNDGVNYFADYRWSGGADRLRWQRHLQETGLPFEGINVHPDNQPLLAEDRLEYWQRAGRLGLEYDAVHGYRPFGLSDELELRMFEGNNYPWIYSRLESTLEHLSPMENPNNDAVGLLRANVREHQESSEYQNQLNNRELVRDVRRKLTLYSGARNDLVEPGLTWFNRNEMAPRHVQQLAELPQGGVNANVWRERVYENYAAQSRQKLDLREPDAWFHDYLSDGSPWYNKPLMSPSNEVRWYSVDDAGRINLRERLARSLLLALTDGPDALEQGVPYTSYYGRYALEMMTSPVDPFGGTATIPAYSESDGPLNRTRRLAAAYAANILKYRSNQPLTFDDAVALPEYGYFDENRPAANANTIEEGYLQQGGDRLAYLPVDPQPFIVEVFLGHVYKPSDDTVPEYHVTEEAAEYLDEYAPGWTCDDIDADFLNFHGLSLDPYTNSGESIIYDREENRSVIIVVQIANPFDVPIDLHDYKLEVFGQVFDMGAPTGLPEEQRYLWPATEENPVTAIFYAIKDQLAGDPPMSLHDKWAEFLDIKVSGADGYPIFPQDTLAPGTIVHRVQDETIWPVNTRAEYDGEHGVGAGLDGLRHHSDGGVVLKRKVRETSDISSTVYEVVVDRIDAEDDRAFANAVAYMGEYKPAEASEYEPLCESPWDNLGYFRAYTVSSNEHWVQWVRATRAWGVDVNGNGIIENHERNPRFVFGDRAVVVPTKINTASVNGENPYEAPRELIDEGEDDGGGGDGEALVGLPGDRVEDIDVAGGIVYEFANDPNEPWPWFVTKYYRANGDLMWEDPALATSVFPARKPTFFDMNFRGDPFSNNGMANVRTYPDKGWYGQYKITAQWNEGLPVVEFFPMEGVGGIEYPPVLHPAGPNQTLLMQPEGNPPVAVDWTGVATPLFRHPFAMQMSLKNKFSEDHFGNPPTYPAWFLALAPAVRDELLLNRDYEQIGEVLNVWLFGHEVKLDTDGRYDTTRTTFAEFMSAKNDELTGLPKRFTSLEQYEHWLREGQAHRVNRLHITPLERIGSSNELEVVLGHVLNHVPQEYYEDLGGVVDMAAWRGDMRHAFAAVPAGARVLDLFVCDGPGRIWKNRFDQPYHPDELEPDRFYNANGFTGRMTPGLININTATPEVLRALPHMTRLIGENYNLQDNPFVKVPEAIVRYRDRLGRPWPLTGGGDGDFGPDYAHRGRPYSNDGGFFHFMGDGLGGFVPHLRGDRGFASLGELGLLTRSGRYGKRWDDPGNLPPYLMYDLSEVNINDDWYWNIIDPNASYRIDYPTMPDRRYYDRDLPTGAESYAYLFREFGPGAVSFVPLSARLSTDTVDEFDAYSEYTGQDYPPGLMPDITAEDAQEANVLLAGISNLVSTRSDTFTVHFRVRSFRQNPATGVWDATDPEYIVDDSRYVMLVDRSNVNNPSDKPRILYLEKLPK